MSLYLPGARLELTFQEFPPHDVVHYNAAMLRLFRSVAKQDYNLSYPVMKGGTMRIIDVGMSQVISIGFCPVPAGKAWWELDW